MREEQRLRPQRQQQAGRLQHGVGVELGRRGIGQHVVARNVHEARSELIAGEQAAGAGVQDHVLMPGVAGGIDESQPVAFAQVQLAAVLGHQQARLRHGLGQAEEPVQVVAKHLAGARDQPAGVDDMTGAVAVHHQPCRQSHILLIAGHVAELGQ